MPGQLSNMTGGRQPATPLDSPMNIDTYTPVKPGALGGMTGRIAPPNSPMDIDCQNEQVHYFNFFFNKKKNKNKIKISPFSVL